MHNSNKVKATMKHRPLKFIYCEAYLNAKDAFQREKWLKTGWGSNQLKKSLFNYLIFKIKAGKCFLAI